MASNPIGREAAAVTLPGMILPLPAVARILSQYDRTKVESFIEVAIGFLDVMDGDPDNETNGDEADGSNGEDESGYCHAGRGLGPGCPYSDPDSAVDDFGCDDINDDRERDDHFTPRYGLDQSRGPIGPNTGRT